MNNWVLRSIIVISIGLIPCTAFSDTIHAIGILQGGFDFSTQTGVDMKTNPECDLALVEVIDPPLGFRVWGLNGAIITMVDSTFEDLQIAPEDTSLYYWDWPTLYNQTYVIRTIEGHYAKFIVLHPEYEIEYVYQPDGSRILDTGVNLESTTWGRVKAIYSE